MPGLRLLVVDDDVDFAESLADVLASRGYQVALAHSGQECLERVEHERYGLVLLDMKMPGMNGVQCLAALRRLQPGIAVVMVTAFTRSELIRQALGSGAVAVLHKPVPVAELLETIAYLTGKGSLLLVDDETDLTEELTAVLTAHGYQVDAVGDLKHAIAALSEHPVDLILLDYRLPDGTGADVLNWLKEQSSSPAVVIVTGYPDDALAELPCISPRDILVKPFQPDALLEVLSRHEALHGKQS